MTSAVPTAEVSMYEQKTTAPPTSRSENETHTWQQGNSKIALERIRTENPPLARGSSYMSFRCLANSSAIMS